MKINITALSREKFSSFGEAVLIRENQSPDSTGIGWKCWYPLENISSAESLSIGIVISDPIPWEVKFMERHLDRTEYVIALEKPIIQVVSLSEPDFPAEPSLSKTEAFLIKPGQAVRIEKGVWHSAALAYFQEPTKYLFLLGEVCNDVPDQDSGLVPFNQKQTIDIVESV